jgi:SAM-dependent methyltransferase
MTRWSELTGGTSGPQYAARFAELAAEGRDMHGEATFCAQMLGAPPARVLDAGCGTGRVAIRLSELGYQCHGVDADESMLQVARATAPALALTLVDLAAPGSAVTEEPADLVVAAGNVIPLLAPGTLAHAVTTLTGALRPGGLLVCGFGLDRAHLPRGCPVTPLTDFEDHCSAAGLQAHDRFGTWDRAPFNPADGYVVTVHRRLP